MRRREFIALVGGAATWPLSASAQKSPTRIGFMAAGAYGSANSLAHLTAIKQGLLDNGLVEGRDYVLETRFAAGHYERFPDMVRELAQSGARVILANTILSVRAAQSLNPPVPIVMLAINDPVRTELIASLARPGGYTTGMATMNEDLTPKLLEFQKELVPAAKTIAVLFNPVNPTNLLYIENLKMAANTFGMTVSAIELRSLEMLESAFLTIAAQRPDTIQLVSDSGNVDLSDQIATFAISQRLPSFSTFTDYALFGGLLAYGVSLRQLAIRAGHFVRRILDGAKPGDLPVEQPTRIELVINLKTAKALGLTVPPSLLSRADEVIE
jgi:putative tryptophan/tyrosine transport system substrate-binding protein